ncbi:putative bifunctional diguanylate cyclase/phosphodiesterase [Glaciecola sp. MF2-115]|uniref:putative bifunctional diguanylate cyclase/phosphodiesterase n=1 Tax=Glaciecola sp. MF2-115 TaxID=3384827 RepID=UPI0039A09800
MINDSEEKLSCQRDIITTLYTDSFGGLLISMLCVLVLIFGYPTEGLMEFKYVWATAFFLILIFRLLDYAYWYKKLKGCEYLPANTKLRFIVGVASSGLMWSVYSIVIFEHVDIIELATTVILFSALAGGGATVLSGDKKLAVFYTTVLLLPLCVLMLLSTDENHNLLGFLGIFFTLILIFASIRSANFTASTIDLKNRNLSLVKEMEVKNKQISEVNRVLEAKVDARTKEIFALSNIDPLTGLYNRTAFSRSLDDILSLCRQENRSLALLFVDLDGFKSVNDTQGHAVGDKVLVAISQRLVLIAKGPAHICRWGGDEFIIVIEDVTSDEAVEFGRDVIKSLSQRIQVGMSKVSVGATIGVAMFPEHGTKESELISLADTAMYVQKAISKSDVCVFSEEMRKTQIREQELKEGLAVALSNKEFHLVYQPVIDNDTKKVSFCEVLLRWNLNGQLVPPQEFIPIAEQFGFIHEIGEWVLQTACHEVGDWIFDESVDLSVNVSVAQLIRSDFIDIIKRVLESSGFPGPKLHLEITESLFASNMETMQKQVHELQKLGIKVSVDDFGTGFSSLSQLQSLSADIVKIDRSFVASMGTGGQAIIQATQYMANELGYSVVAEGVETREQADQLSNIGITCSQGFYFSHPMTIAELPNWFDEFNETKTLNHLDEESGDDTVDS